MNLILYNCLISCSPKDVSVVVDWLYNFLEDRFEIRRDDLTPVEQDYLRVMLDYVHEAVMLKLSANYEKVEWIHSSNKKICIADTDESLWITETDCEGSVKILKEIELEVPIHYELSVADKLIIKHRLRRSVEKLFIGFKSIKDQLPELLKQAIVSSEAIVIMKSTSIETDLCNCLNCPVLVIKEWLHDMLEDRFEGGCDDLISEEQEYLRRMLDCLYDCLYVKDDCLKEASILQEFIPMDVETDHNNTDYTHNLQNDSEYREQKSNVDKFENAAKQKYEIEHEGCVFGTNYQKGTPIVDVPKRRTIDDFAWRCKKSITKRDIKKAKQLAIHDRNPNRPVKRFESKNFVDKKELERQRIVAKGLAPSFDTTNLYSVLDNKLWVETCRMFDSSHNDEDNVTVGKEVKYDIKVGFLNMNSLAADCKIEYILWY